MEMIVVNKQQNELPKNYFHLLMRKIKFIFQLFLTEPILMGWSSGGAMASAFLGYANEHGFVTAGGRNGTRYTVRGLVLLMAGSQFCYAYHSRCPKGSNQQRVCADCMYQEQYYLSSVALAF